MSLFRVLRQEDDELKTNLGHQVRFRIKTPRAWGRWREDCASGCNDRGKLNSAVRHRTLLFQGLRNQSQFKALPGERGSEYTRDRPRTQEADVPTFQSCLTLILMDWP